MEYWMEHRDRVELQVEKRAVRTSRTESEHDGQETNIDLDKFVGFLRLPESSCILESMGLMWSPRW